MSKLDILKYPDRRLRIIAEPINKIDKKISRLISDMRETMYSENGIGLAATQVNVHKQLIVLDVSEQRNKAKVLINPVINHKKGTFIHKEGCLSFPGIYAEVERHEEISVSFLNEKGIKCKLVSRDLESICIQHEIDHLKGKVFVDYLSRLKRERIEKKLKKIKN